MSHHATAQCDGSAEQITARLAAGNRRFVEGEPRQGDTGPRRRLELVCGQNPVAAVLACSDSRVGPEAIFDQGLGDLFVVRVAGNVIDDTVLGSLEYAVEHLGVPLVLVMGHSSCGAVTSACSCDLDRLEGATGALLRAIRPAVQAARETCCLPNDLVDTSARENVRTQVEAVLQSPVIRAAAIEGRVTVQGAWYDLQTGLVSWL
jgi:carbonic anhydrase